MAFRQLPLTRSGALLLAILPAGTAWAEGWTPSPVEMSSADALGANFEVAVRGGYASGLVPPFRVGARDRTAIGIDARVWFNNRVRVTISEEWLHDQTVVGAPVTGFGDIRLGTTVAVLNGPVVATGIGWEAKLPNATDAGELGTDETDITFGAWCSVSSGDWTVAAAAGLAVLGNPLRFANQDDVPLARLGGAFSPGAFTFGVAGHADFATARNPARIQLDASARYGRTWFVAVNPSIGLVPASADASGVLQVGYAWALPERRAGE